MRNLKVDLETCNRASKAPWRVATNKHPTTSGNSWGWVEGTRENWCWSNDNKKSYADARFIAQAREGWPHAIERAIEAEALARELVEAAGALVDDLEWSDKVYASWPPYVQRVEVLLAKAKEVLGNDRQGDYRTP